MRPVQLFCWHFMAYPYLPADFDDRYETGWVTVPNSASLKGGKLGMLAGAFFS